MKTLEDYALVANQHVETIDATIAYENIKNGQGAILDVRELDELENAGSIEGALHVPRGLLEAKADKKAKPNEDLIAHRDDQIEIYTLCASGMRALLASHTLKEMGYRSVVIKGGFEGWQDAGLPVNR